jgi:hypothetical protein
MLSKRQNARTPAMVLRAVSAFCHHVQRVFSVLLNLPPQVLGCRQNTHRLLDRVLLVVPNVSYSSFHRRVFSARPQSQRGARLPSQIFHAFSRAAWNGLHTPLTLSFVLVIFPLTLLLTSPLASLSNSAFCSTCSISRFLTHTAFSLPLI